MDTSRLVQNECTLPKGGWCCRHGECKGEGCCEHRRKPIFNPKSNEWGQSERYNWHPGKIECIDVIEPFDYNLATAMKYIWRAGSPAGSYDGDRLEDLRKAIRYLTREGERLSHEAMLPSFQKSLEPDFGPVTKIPKDFDSDQRKEPAAEEDLVELNTTVLIPTHAPSTPCGYRGIHIKHIWMSGTNIRACPGFASPPLASRG